MIVRLLLLCCLLGPTTALGAFGQEPLRVAVAASAGPALKELARQYEQSRGDRVDVVVGSTGRLYAQIVNGAPFDLFFAADSERPESLVVMGLAEPESRWVYAVGRLVLWIPGRKEWQGRGLVEVLKDPLLRKLAVANPRTAPYGRAAVEALEAMGSPVEGDRLVFGEDVGQTLQLVATGAASGGLVSWSQMFGGRISADRAEWVLPAELHPEIQQQAVRLSRSRHPASSDFLLFARSPAGIAILADWGLGHSSL